MIKKIELHDNISRALVHTLDKIMKQGEYADKFVPYFVKQQKKWGSRDRKIFTHILYSVIRNYRYNEEVLKRNSIDITTENILGFELYRSFSDAISNHNFTFDIAQPLPDIHDYMFPQWLIEKFTYDYPEMKAGDFSLLDQKAKTYIRANTIRTSQEELFKALSENQDIKKVEDSEEALEITSSNNLIHSKLYAAGFFEFQDLASQRVAHFAEVEGKRSILDLCAGAGGKTLHLSAVMQNKGKIYATDVDASRLTRLIERMKKTGVKNVELIHYEDVGIRLYDVILIDAPCSGTGTFKRQPDAKWKINEAFIAHNMAIQIELLEKASTLLDTSGAIVYVTCSILKDEGERQVANFLENHPDFKLQKSFRTDCFNADEDGFYMALIIKK